MKQLYSNLNVLLTPDIVLSLRFIQNNVEHEKYHRTALMKPMKKLCKVYIDSSIKINTY